MRRRVAMGAAALSALVAAPLAHAASWAQAGVPGQPVGSATWAAGLTQSGGVVPGPLSVAVPRSARTAPPPAYLDVVNSGTLPLLGATYTVTVTGQREVLLEHCQGSWDEVAHTCTGAVTVLATSVGGPAAAEVVPPQPGDRSRLRLRLPRTLPQDAVVTVEVHVARAQARAAVTSSG